MAAVVLTLDHLTPFATIEEAKAQEMIDDALARAARVAPCIRDEELSADHATAARGIIRDAILRWNEAGTGALTTTTVGAVSEGYDTRQPRRTLFWPSEIAELQAICREHAGDTSDGAFSIRPTGPGTLAGHTPYCDLMFGGATCSCGYTLSGGVAPIYEPWP